MGVKGKNKTCTAREKCSFDLFLQLNFTFVFFFWFLEMVCLDWI